MTHVPIFQEQISVNEPWDAMAEREAPALLGLAGPLWNLCRRPIPGNLEMGPHNIPPPAQL